KKVTLAPPVRFEGDVTVFMDRIRDAYAGGTGRRPEMEGRIQVAEESYEFSDSLRNESSPRADRPSLSKSRPNRSRMASTDESSRRRFWSLVFPGPTASSTSSASWRTWSVRSPETDIPRRGTGSPYDASRARVRLDIPIS